jgi:hypothetical protein
MNTEHVMSQFAVLERLVETFELRLASLADPHLRRTSSHSAYHSPSLLAFASRSIASLLHLTKSQKAKHFLFGGLMLQLTSSRIYPFVCF